MTPIKDTQDNRKGQAAAGVNRKKSLPGFIQWEMSTRHACGYYQSQWCVWALSLEKGLDYKGSLKPSHALGRESAEEGCDGLR